MANLKIELTQEEVENIVREHYRNQGGFKGYNTQSGSITTMITHSSQDGPISSPSHFRMEISFPKIQETGYKD